MSDDMIGMSRIALTFVEGLEKALEDNPDQSVFLLERTDLELISTYIRATSVLRAKSPEEMAMFMREFLQPHISEDLLG